MSKRKKLLRPIMVALALLLGLTAWNQVRAAEPEMATYTAMPAFMSATTVPLIMIVLDNSGSMNERAYYDDYHCGKLEQKVNSSRDMAEELVATGDNWAYSGDFDMGGLNSDGSNPTYCAVRFWDIPIPQGTAITRAYIKFRARASNSGSTSLNIAGEASDSAQQYTSGSYGSFVAADNSDISGRPSTATTVAWNNIPAWSAGNWYDTPDLTGIVQEIIDRPGWESGNAMAFKIWGSGHRNAYESTSSSYSPVLVIEYDRTACKKYYGYFDPTSKYTYDGSKFVRDAAGDWDGNFLNWATMRKLDVARKVMVGGLATSRTGGGNTNLYGEKTTARTWTKYYDGDDVSPYHGDYRYYIYNGYIYVYDSNWNYVDYYDIQVKKVETEEPDDFHQGNIAGVMQKVGDRAYWGNMWFYTGDSNNRQGGFVSNRVGQNMTTLVTDLQNTPGTTWTPLAETYYICTRYFAQESPESGLGYSNSAAGSFNNTMDPYYQNGDFLACAKSFVIILTDGASTKDSKIPDWLQDYDGDGDRLGCDEGSGSNCDYGSGGTDYLDDVALYARTVDLRDDLDGDQTLILYTIYAFGNDSNARSLLQDAARNGGFDDENGNNIPDLQQEYDKDNDGVPDNYFEASDGYELEAQLMSAITDILKRASSGTAVSVLATSSEGEGTLVQAYFKPTVPVGLDEVKWAGYLHNLWVDSYGRVREDTVQEGADPGLVLENDKIVEFFFDEGTGEASFKRFELDAEGDKKVGFTDSNGNGKLDYLETYVDANGNDQWDDAEPFVDSNGNQTWDDVEVYDDENGNGQYDVGEPFWDADGDGVYDDTAESFTDVDGDGEWNDAEDYDDANGNDIWDAGEDWWYIYSTHKMDELKPIWEAGEKLQAKTAANRTIKTFVDLDHDGVLDSGEWVDFTAANAASITPFLGVKDDATWSYLGGTQAQRANNLIQFIRGDDSGLQGTYNLRFRDINGSIWKLGDIIHSTPITVGRPLDNYGLIYKDETYEEYYTLYKKREQVVYVGGNDGMLHAFFMGRTNNTDNPATNTVEEKIYFDKETTTAYDYGEEMWGYVPQSLLPHLKWLANTEYTHVYYVDLKPKVFDARIFPDDATHPNGWGTVLVGGLNLGGKAIDATDDFPEGVDSTRNFGSCYFAIDVTDPHNPVLLWERSSAEIPAANCPTGDCHFENLALTTSLPGVAKVGASWNASDTGNGWFLVFGSGPEDYDGSSNQEGHVFVVDLLTGKLRNTFVTNEDYAFMASPSTVDMGLNYNVDVGYIGETYHHKQGNTWSWKGFMYRFKAPKLFGNYRTQAGTDTYDNDPAHWLFEPLLETEGPITAPATASVDSSGNLWVYFGTGRFFSDADKSDQAIQYFYGVKDPIYNSNLYPDSSYPTLASVMGVSLTHSDLLETTNVQVFTDKEVSGITGVTNWGELVAAVRAENGWYLQLLDETGSPEGERVLNKPTVLGGVVFDTTFIPNDDPCGFDGTTNIFGLYYLTGTSFYQEVFANGSEEVTTGPGQTQTLIQNKVEVGVGRGSSVAVHVGQQDGATGYVQQSTGIVENLELHPAANVRSGFVYWREQ